MRDQSEQLTAGALASPGYRTNRALQAGLLPKDDPELREATPKSISSLTLGDVRDYYTKVFRPDMTTITVIGDITPQEAETVFEKWFGGWRSSGTKPSLKLPPVPPNPPAAANVPDSSQVQDSVELAQEVV